MCVCVFECICDLYLYNKPREALRANIKSSISLMSSLHMVNTHRIIFEKLNLTYS